VRKDHNTGRNHLQNVRDYYLSLDQAQNEAIYANVLREYDLRGLPHPVFTYQPPGGGFGGGGYGGGGGGEHSHQRGICFETS
jgi:U1 small nuclear ribonucleoprotein C